jgi:AcrR family transcriptional regulator
MSVPERRAGTKGMPREERETQILDAATIEFATRGYVGGSVEQIARTVGVSRAMIHAYFGGKDELYAACIVRAGEPLVAAVASVQDPDTAPLPRAFATIQAILTTLEPRRHDWPLLYDLSLPASSPAYAEARRYRQALARLGSVGTLEVVSRGGDREAGEAELLGHLWLDVVGSIVRWWLQHPSEPADVAVARLARVLGYLVVDDRAADTN